MKIRAILSTGVEMHGSTDAVLGWVMEQLGHRPSEILPIRIEASEHSSYAEASAACVQWTE